MDKNTNPKAYKPLILILVIMCLFLICTVGLLLIYPMVSTDDPTQETQPTQATEEKFVTDIEFEYFDDPVDFLNYISVCTDFYFPEGYTSGALEAKDKDSGIVKLDETERIVSYIGNLYYKDLSDEKAAIIEEQIAKDERFIKSLGDLKILIGSVGGDNIYEYKMVYNMDTKEYNTMPDKAGEYSLITIFYEADENYFAVERLNNKYWKLEKSAQ